MNKAIIIEIYCKSEVLQNTFSESELRLIESFLPELLSLMGEEDAISCELKN